MAMDESVRKAVLAAVPSLRAFAISLCGNVDRADDLVQETLMRAIANIDSFQPGTNMSAWLFTILRNHFRSEYRKRRLGIFLRGSRPHLRLRGRHHQVARQPRAHAAR